MNYLELENYLCKKINNLERCRTYMCDNFITPNVIGFVHLKKDYKYEITYGRDFYGRWLIGVTLFNKNKLVKDIQGVNACFYANDVEINELNNFINNKRDVILNEN